MLSVLENCVAICGHKFSPKPAGFLLNKSPFQVHIMNSLTTDRQLQMRILLLNNLDKRMWMAEAA